MVSKVIINGVAIEVSGNDVNIVNGKVFVDGKEVNGNKSNGPITIEIHGDVKNLSVNTCDKISIDGGVGSVSTQTGDVKCGDVSGSVSTQTGDVKCGSVGGGVSTVTGDIKGIQEDYSSTGKARPRM